MIKDAKFIKEILLYSKKSSQSNVKKYLNFLALILNLEEDCTTSYMCKEVLILKMIIYAKQVVIV